MVVQLSHKIFARFRKVRLVCFYWTLGFGASGDRAKLYLYNFIRTHRIFTIFMIGHSITIAAVIIL
jgi:hypothetical protein